MLLSVLGNRLEAVVREMTNTLQRAGRSATINMARDFSCAIVTGDNQLLASAEGLPAHIYGMHLQTRSMGELHDDLAPGDAYLHNDVYLGNSHAGDHAVLVPVFFEGEHLFTCCAKGHLPDIGNSLPTSYFPGARDVYEEGALIFPCVRVQRDYEDVADIIRMCRKRIRVPDQWYGDYLAMLGAARVGERRLGELAGKHGAAGIRDFVREWLDYSERRMEHAIRQRAAARVVAEGRHDPFPALPDGLPLKVIIDVDPKSGTIEVDLRDNVDCVDAGVNESEACAINSVMQGIFSSLEPDIPHNAGSFRRVRVHLRENCVVGIPRFPHSCSLATTNPAARLINLTQAALAEADGASGVAEGGIAFSAGYAVISGADWRRDGAPYVNQLMLANNGGPASATADGWVTYGNTAVAGLLYRDSVEIDEQRYPIHIQSMVLQPDSGGPGRFRGAPGIRIVYGPKRDPVMIATFFTDGYLTPARGVCGGEAGGLAYAGRVDANGHEEPLPLMFAGELEAGEWVVAIDCGGGGFGDPLDRDPDRVRDDVLEGWVSLQQARHAYGVVFAGEGGYDALAVDARETDALRVALRSRRGRRL
ncbi:MAG TPA: hydantoinase B/oxoprolinase family protein [Solirubrobacteraceae bacterium]